MAVKRKNSILRERSANSWFVDRQIVVEVVAVATVGIAFLIFISLIFCGRQGFGTIEEGGKLTGIVGGYVSFALYKIFGYAAFLIPVFVIMVGIFLVIGKRDIVAGVRLGSFLFFVVLLACFLNVIFPGVNGGKVFSHGGLVGEGVSKLLMPLFGRYGTLTLVVTMAIVSVLLMVQIPFRKGLWFVWFGGLYAGRTVRRFYSWIFLPRFSEGPRQEAVKVDIEDQISSKRQQSYSQKSHSSTLRKKQVEEEISTGGTSYRLPPCDLLSKGGSDGGKGLSRQEILLTCDRLVDTLSSYGIEGEIVGVNPGPVVTTYEFRPRKGTRISSITNRQDDIAMSLEAQKVRIIAPIPGKNAIGFEIPNRKRQIVFLREILEDGDFTRKKKKIPLALGKDIIGSPYVADLDRMPHLLVAGTTGSGKSVCINSIILSLLYSFTPDELKLILVDPKTVEMQTYSRIPHLLLPVVTDPHKAAIALKWAVDEMERRYQLFASTDSKNLQGYNSKIKKLISSGGDSPQLLPYIVIVIDELADLMMAEVRKVEEAIIRLAQLARASGIHLVVSTQRPSTNVVTGLIKANFPCRVAFKVASRTDSRVILDANGAEALLGDGDMLIMPPGLSDLVRVQGAFVTESETRKVCDFWSEQAQPAYREDILEEEAEEEEVTGVDNHEDEFYNAAVELVLREGKASVSFIQRRLRLGYNRAARIMEAMEKNGIVGPMEPGKHYREILAGR